MKAQRFEYQNKDVPMLKKEVFFRMLFMLLFVAIFVWQFVLFVFSYIHGNLTTIKLLAAIAVLIVALLFAMVSFIYGLRCLNIIQKIALHGNAVIFNCYPVNCNCHDCCYGLHNNIFCASIRLFYNCFLLFTNSVFGCFFWV